MSADKRKEFELLRDNPEVLKEVEDFVPEAEPELIADPAPGIEVVGDSPKKVEPVDGEALVADVENFISKYVRFPQQRMALVLALWAIGTNRFDTFDCFPYTTITSPTKRCGKTRLAEVTELLCAEPLRAANLSEAVLFRLIDTKSPTLFLDESEPLRNKKSERAQAIVGLLNAGHRKGSVAYRCHGPGHEVKAFQVYCPKMIISIGDVPETIRDRSIVVQMQRNRKNDTVGRFIFKNVRGPGADLKERIVEIVSVCGQDIEDVYDSCELEFLSDREEENWTPIFVLCSVLAPRRLAELKETAIACMKGKSAVDADDERGIRLIADLNRILGDGRTHGLFGEKQKTISSAALIVRLKEIEEGPWVEFDLNAHRLARLLKHFGVYPAQVWDSGRNVRGYQVSDFMSLFSRYLGVEVLEPLKGA